MTSEQPMFTTNLVNLYNRNIFKTSLYIYIFQDEKCRLMRNLSLSMVLSGRLAFQGLACWLEVFVCTIAHGTVYMVILVITIILF